MLIYLAGQDNFGNRGCEALIRSTTKMVRARMAAVEFQCPSFKPELDARQWPNAEEQGIRFVSAPPITGPLRWWGRLTRRVPVARHVVPPPKRPDPETQRLIDRSDALIMTGGDTISLDYGTESLYHWVGLAEAAQNRGIPSALWAASVGPFSADPVVERDIVRHLQRYDLITVRETETFAYLGRLGLEKVNLVADPAFLLEPEAWDWTSMWPAALGDVLGFNVSPLIRSAREKAGSADALDRDIQVFLERVVKETKLSVLLLPHVDLLDGGDWNSDSAYMSRLLAGLSVPAGRVVLAPRTLNAAQLKFAIGKCRYFIGARTHATVAALSQGIPTISIAYSIKAVGLNKDLFGDTRYVLPTPTVSEATLWTAFERLRGDEAQTKDVLAQRIPEWRARAVVSADKFCALFPKSAATSRESAPARTRDLAGAARDR